MIRLFFRQERFILILVGLIVPFVWGSYQGIIRGGHDFSVFYQSWELVLGGRGADIYRVSPDRFLYAPSFAWLLSPFALFPKNYAFLFWSALKFIFILFALLDFHRLMERTHKTILPLWITFAGILWVARPVLIDIEYGQVNLFIVAVSLSALCGHFEEKSHTCKDLIRWVLLGSFAVAKIFALPLLVIPWIVTRSIPKKKLMVERSAIGFCCHRGAVDSCRPARMGWSFRTFFPVEGSPFESRASTRVSQPEFYCAITSLFKWSRDRSEIRRSTNDCVRQPMAFIYSNLLLISFLDIEFLGFDHCLDFVLS